MSWSTYIGNVPLSFSVQMVRSAGALASKVVSNVQSWGEMTVGSKSSFLSDSTHTHFGLAWFWVDLVAHGSLCCPSRKVGLAIPCYGFAQMDRTGCAPCPVPRVPSGHAGMQATGREAVPTVGEATLPKLSKLTIATSVTVIPLMQTI